MIKLDYTLDSPQERNELVKKILEENPEPTDRYKEILADYLVLCMEKQERKQKKILTDNRLVTINSHETSFEGLVSQLENGENGLYNLIKEDKQQILKPKTSITKGDLEKYPELRQVREAIHLLEKQLIEKAGTKEAYIIKRAIIDLRKDQYLIKNAYTKPINLKKTIQTKHYMEIPDLTHKLNSNNYPIYEGVSLLNPKVCSFILCNYSKLKQDSWDNLKSDLWHLMEDFDILCEKTFKNYPLYDRLIQYKIDGLQNSVIQNELDIEFGVRYSLEYISSLWRKKLPKMLASQAESDWLNNYYLNKEYGKYKKCSRCGQIKLAHNKYFSRNDTSKDGWYSICKECRNKKVKNK